MKHTALIAILVLTLSGGYQSFRNQRCLNSHPLSPAENLSPAVPYSQRDLDRAAKMMRDAKMLQDHEAASTRGT